jgi:copper(I)-binding protein/Cu/Ag efflux protein CusF
MITAARITAVAAAIAIPIGANAWAHTAKRGNIEIIHPWVEPSEGYSTRTHPTIWNEGEDPVTLVGAETSIADQMLIIQDGLVLDKFVIAGEDVVSFGDEGLHLTLVGLKEPLEEGTHFPVTFRFDGAESIEFHMVVGESTMMPDMDIPEMSGDEGGGTHEMHGGDDSENGHGDHGEKHGDNSKNDDAHHGGHGDTHGQMHDSEDMHANAVMQESAPGQETTLTITHAPIEAIGWPEMTTDFSLADGTDLPNVDVGDRVYFVLVAESDGIYAVKSLDHFDRGRPTTSGTEFLGNGVIEAMTGN